MQFVANGPDIPDELIRLWRTGEVVFLVGAGVSKPPPSRLPLFRELTLKVYQQLSDPLYAALAATNRKNLTQKTRNQILAGRGLNPQRTVEANLFFRGEYDRLFSALEARLDQNARGETISRQVRDAVENILSAHGGHNLGHQDIIRLSTAPRTNTDGTINGLTSRVITTNFDLLFEQAAAQELPGQTPSFDVRTAPRPGAYDFEGIIHLHGMLRQGTIPSSLILSSRDFARTYLRSGVVANYVYDLMRQFTLVLVGYSAEDQTMRYLMDAIAEDAALFGDMPPAYAIAAMDQTTTSLEVFAQTWREKNIQPIIYRADANYQVLWETFRHWADWSRRDLEWVKEKLADATALPPAQSEAFAQNFVKSLFTLLDASEQKSAIGFLSERAVDFDWIDILCHAPSDQVRRDEGDLKP